MTAASTEAKRDLSRAAGAAEALDTRAVCHALAPDLDLAELRVGAGTAVQLWPHRHGTDAMFMAVLRRGDEEGR